MMCADVAGGRSGHFDGRMAILDVRGNHRGFYGPARQGQGGTSSERSGPDVTAKIGVAIVGASGYAVELIEILLRHPHVQITAATSRQDEAPRLDALHPSLARRIDLNCEVFDADQIASRASFAFLALPHTASMAVVPPFRQSAGCA